MFNKCYDTSHNYGKIITIEVYRSFAFINYIFYSYYTFLHYTKYVILITIILTNSSINSLCTNPINNTSCIFIKIWLFPSTVLLFRGFLTSYFSNTPYHFIKNYFLCKLFGNKIYPSSNVNCLCNFLRDTILFSIIYVYTTLKRFFEKRII